MAFSLYDATVPSWQQILGSVSGLLDKAQAYCLEQQLAPESIIASRLAEDMLPFGFQVKSTVAHSIGAIKGLRRGVFSPDKSPWPDSFAGLREMLASAIGELSALDPAEINAFEGRDMRFEMGNYKVEFTAENFLLSFSQPNFYFHATTAYDILRAKGLAIGKKDFIGRLRKKT